MEITIDIRGLGGPHQSGVGMYTLHLLRALFDLDTKNNYVLFSSGSKKTLPHLPSFSFPNVHNTHLRIPNRLLKITLLLTGRPQFPQCKKQDSLVFLPSVNISSIHPSVPYLLTIHDLSFTRIIFRK